MREDLHGDVNGHRINGHVTMSPPGIRRAVMADVPLWLERAMVVYPGRPVERSRAWIEWCIRNPERLVLVGETCAGIAQADWMYGFERRARLDVLFVTEPSWETLRLLRIMLDWARQQGATGTFRLDADTGIDFGPFARRLGGKPVTLTRYEIPL